MTNLTTTPPLLLIPGHWLGAWAWDDLLPHLDVDAARVSAITLPGLDADDDARSTRTVADQATAILEAMTGLGASREDPAVLVAHSGANAPVSLVLDEHPALVRRVIWVDSGPLAPGTAFAPDFPDAAADLPLPPFDALAQQASLDGLSPSHLERFRTRAVPEPGPVIREAIALTNAARHAVPTTLVCCSITSAQVHEWANGGHPMFAEVSLLEHVETIDLPTGHWPMWSRPRDLAAVITSAVCGSA